MDRSSRGLTQPLNRQSESCHRKLSATRRITNPSLNQFQFLQAGIDLIERYETYAAICQSK
jgi:hypothetical protein